MEASGLILAISCRSPRLAWLELSGRRSLASWHPDSFAPSTPLLPKSPKQQPYYRVLHGGNVLSLLYLLICHASIKTFYPQHVTHEGYLKPDAKCEYDPRLLQCSTVDRCVGSSR